MTRLWFFKADLKNWTAMFTKRPNKAQLADKNTMEIMLFYKYAIYVSFMFIKELR